MRNESGAHASDLDTLRVLNDGYIRSVQRSDVGWFEKFLAEDFLNSNPDGTLVDRAGFLRQIAKPVAISNFKSEDVQIRIFDDFALIHARTTYSAADGRAVAGRYTDTWARRNGRWLCVAAHVTRG